MALQKNILVLPLLDPDKRLVQSHLFISWQAQMTAPSIPFEIEFELESLCLSASSRMTVQYES
jgi:hypothetical protein